MRWPWRRHLPAPPDVPVHLEEAERAVSQARDHLAETRHRDGTVYRTAQALRQIRAEDDFARSIREALKP
jgi:hypothetical protein